MSLLEFFGINFYAHPMEQDRLIASHIIERVSPSVEILVFCYFLSVLFDQSYTSFLYSTKIKEQNRKLTAGCSKYSFEVADKTDEVSSKHCFEVVDRTDEVSNHIYGKVKLMWFEEIFEEY